MTDVTTLLSTMKRTIQCGPSNLEGIAQPALQTPAPDCCTAPAEHICHSPPVTVAGVTDNNKTIQSAAVVSISPAGLKRTLEELHTRDAVCSQSSGNASILQG